MKTHSNSKHLLKYTRFAKLAAALLSAALVFASLSACDPKVNEKIKNDPAVVAQKDNAVKALGDAPCDSDTFVEEGICMPKFDVGEECDSGHKCKNDACCDGRCSHEKCAPGGGCDDDQSCATDECADSKCACGEEGCPDHDCDGKPCDDAAPKNDVKKDDIKTP